MLMTIKEIEIVFKEHCHMLWGDNQTYFTGSQIPTEVTTTDKTGKKKYILEVFVLYSASNVLGFTV